MGDGVEELLRHVSAGHGSGLLQFMRVTTPGRKLHATPGFVRVFILYAARI
jgi:hypothetical protein